MTNTERHLLAGHRCMGDRSGPWAQARGNSFPIPVSTRVLGSPIRPAATSADPAGHRGALDSRRLCRADTGQAHPSPPSAKTGGQDRQTPAGSPRGCLAMFNSAEFRLLSRILDATGMVSGAAMLTGSDPRWCLHGFAFGEATPPVMLREDAQPPDGLDQVTFYEGFMMGSAVWTGRELGARAD